MFRRLLLPVLLLSAVVAGVITTLLWIEVDLQDDRIRAFVKEHIRGDMAIFEKDGQFVVVVPLPGETAVDWAARARSTVDRALADPAYSNPNHRVLRWTTTDGGEIIIHVERAPGETPEDFEQRVADIDAAFREQFECE